MMTSKMEIGRAIPARKQECGTSASLAIAAAACLALPAWASAQTCPEPMASDFKKTTLIAAGALDRPVHMAVAPDGRVFIGEMATGNIQVYKPGQSAPVLAGKVDTRFENEDGLLGVAVPPDFATSQFVYVLATDPNRTTRSHVLWRYKLNGDKLDAPTKTEILRIPRVASGQYHAAGGLHFDKQGNLWISSGDDTNPHDTHNSGYGPIYTPDAGADAQKSSSNTNDLRGKISRIHPEAAQTGGKWYTIPSGNLKEAMASFWSAAELEKVRPEIYAFGMRNPYRFTYDDQNNWLIWGEVGPDANSDNANRGRMGHDEFNLAASPGYYGWPYCNGNQFAYNSVDYSTNTTTGVVGAKFDCANLVNNSPNNTGVSKLPPARAPLIWYAAGNSTDFKQMGSGAETALGGPLYRYSKELKSTTKFPPQYDGRMMIWDWSRRTHKFISFTADGKLDKWFDFPVANMKSDVAAQFGPEGSLYVLQYSDNGYGDNNSALLRIDYTGAIDDACAPVVSAVSRASVPDAAGINGLISGFQQVELPAGAAGLEAFDLSGRKVWTFRRGGAAGVLRVEFPKSLASGLLRVRFL